MAPASLRFSFTLTSFRLTATWLQRARQRQRPRRRRRLLGVAHSIYLGALALASSRSMLFAGPRASLGRGNASSAGNVDTDAIFPMISTNITSSDATCPVSSSPMSKPWSATSRLQRRLGGGRRLSQRPERLRGQLQCHRLLLPFTPKS